MSSSLIIGVTGGSGSGKTHLVRKISRLFSGAEVAVISQDNYYRPIEEQMLDHNGVTNFDLPTALALADFCRDVERLQEGEVVERREYVFNNSNATPGLIRILPARVILVEGLFLLHDIEIMRLLDLSVFVEVEPGIKLSRRIARDSEERNYPIEDVQYRFEHHVTPAFEQFIAPHRHKADIIVNNNRSLDRAADVLAAFIREKLDS